MKKQLFAAMVLASVTLTGCASKRPPANAANYAPGVEQEGSGGAVDPQAALIAAAGSDRVLFDLDSSTLTSYARQILGRQATWLQQHPPISFTIEGHCDERGTREYNLALGDRRARAAASFLTAQGVSPGRIRTISYGKERPEAFGSDDDSYAQNRRAVSIVIQPGG